MPSKRSFFNRTLFRKNLSRFWPLWGGISLVGAMLPLYLMLALIQQAEPIERQHFAEGMYQLAAGFVPAFTCCYAILCAMAVWGYLYNARAVGMMHTLPVDRTCLLVTNTLSGLAMVLIPYAVVGAMVCLIALGWGFFDLVAIVNTVVTVLMITLLFFGMATLCAMLTGHSFVLPVFYLLANFLAFFMEMLTTTLAEEFLLGVGVMENMGRLCFLSPVIQIYKSFRVQTEILPGGGLEECRLTGLWVVVLYALIGAVMLALAWFLYQKRHSESAGDVVAFRWLRPVFRYGLALLSGLTVGRLLFELFWVPLFQRGYYADPVPMGICLFLGGLVGYYAASMLLEKSLRVFKGSWRGALLVAAGAAAVCLLVSVDMFGLEARVPGLEEIESVTVLDRGVESGPYSAEEDREVVEELRRFHQTVVDSRDYIRSYAPDWDQEELRAFSHTIRLVYRLKNGSTLERLYDLWLTSERVKTDGTFDNLLSAFYQNPAVRASETAIPKDARLDDIDIFCDYTELSYASTSDHAGGQDTETQALYAALQKDAEEGNVPARDVLRFSNKRSYAFYLELRYRTYNARENSYHIGYKPVYLAPSMTRTLEALVEMGYVTQAELEAWQRDLSMEQ